MDAQCDRSWVIVAAIGGFAGTLRRLPLRPLPRIATALLIGACAAAAKAVVLRPRQEEALGAEAAAGSAANGQQEPAAAAQQQVQVAAALQQQRQHDSEQARLEAQLGINEALRTASPGERVKLIEHSWGQRRPALKWSLRRMLTCIEIHNMRALCVRPPDLEECTPSELVRFFNRAGMAIPEGLLLPPMMPCHWEQLRTAAQIIWQHWEFQRFAHCLLVSKRDGLICQAALRMPRLVGAGNRLRGAAERQMEELRQNLLYNDDLMRDTSQFVESGRLEEALDTIHAMIPRMLAAEGRRADGQAWRRYDRQEGHDEPPPVARRFDPYVLLYFVPGLA